MKKDKRKGQERKGQELEGLPAKGKAEKGSEKKGQGGKAQLLKRLARERPERKKQEGKGQGEGKGQSAGKGQGGSERTQIAALPFRLDGQGRMEVLLVTSRETRRWIVPKGWPMKGVPDQEAAAREAHEEAGVIGQVGAEPAGSYLYWKRLAHSFALCSVKVFPLRVAEVEAEFREMGQRETRWFDVDEAAESVDEPGLSTLIRRFKPAP